MNWSFQGIAQLPALFRIGDSRRFNHLAIYRDFEVKQDGQTLRISCHSLEVNPRRKVTTDVSESWALTWAKSNGHIIPKARTTHLLATENGKLNTKMDARITFEKSSIGPVDFDNEFTIARMGVKPGTPAGNDLKPDSPLFPRAEALLRASKVIGDIHHLE